MQERLEVKKDLKSIIKCHNSSITRLSTYALLIEMYNLNVNKVNVFWINKMCILIVLHVLLKYRLKHVLSASLTSFLVVTFDGLHKNRLKQIAVNDQRFNEWIVISESEQWKRRWLRSERGTNIVCIIRYILKPSELSLLCLTFKICLKMQMRWLSGSVPLFHITNQKVHLSRRDKQDRLQSCCGYRGNTTNTIISSRSLLVFM